MIEGHATVLLVADLEAAVAYYRDKLGFSVDVYEAEPDLYAYARRDGCLVHFACYAGARPRPNSEAVPPDLFDIYVYVGDPDALYDELVGRGADLLSAPRVQEYGMREFRVRDPHGYILAFGTLVQPSTE